MPRLNSCKPLGFILFTLLVSAPFAFTQDSASSQPAPAPAYLSNPKYVAAIDEAKKETKQHRTVFAVDAYKKASKIAGGQDPRSLEALVDLQLKTGEFKDAVATSTQLEAIASTPISRSVAEVYRGRALYGQSGDKHKPELLQAADAAFKAALANDPKNGNAYFMDGHVLAYLGQLDAAGKQFKECLSCISTQDPSYLRAQHFADNPALSTAKMAPAFQVVALDGAKFNLDAMGGRVVLIDFWATWCGPCLEELPHIKKIAEEFAEEPLVIISVSWDSDAEKWKNFINKNEMTWVQYRDADHSLSTAFGINAIPHYFTIDSDGVLTSEMLGSGSDVEGKLKKLIAKTKAKAGPANSGVGN